jgi:hypothetical protein
MIRQRACARFEILYRRDRAAVTPSGAVCSDILHLPARVLVTVADRPRCPRGVERRERTADDDPHDDHGAPSAALRPPASGSRPPHRGRDHRHRSRDPSLDGRGWLGRSTASPPSADSSRFTSTNATACFRIRRFVDRRRTRCHFGTGDTVPASLTSSAAAARRAGAEANRSAACATCPSVEAAPDD